MSLINFNEIDCKKSINQENAIINFNGSKIEIVKYLSANDKYDLIMCTLQKAFDKNIYNAFKMDLFFELNVIYSYTNIVFSDEDRIDEASLYDTLKRSGLIDLVLAQIDSNELSYLKQCIINSAETIIKYRNTFGAVFSALVEQLPENVTKVNTMIKDVDLEKMKALLSLVKEIAPQSEE